MVVTSSDWYVFNKSVKVYSRAFRNFGENTTLTYTQEILDPNTLS